MQILRLLSTLPLTVLLLVSANPLVGEDVSFARRSFPLGEPIFGIDAVDLNQDGTLDIVAASASRVWGMIEPEGRVVQLAETPGGRTIHLIALDCDADGDLDVVLARSASDWIRYREAIKEGKAPKAPEGDDWTVAWLENTGNVQSPWPLHVVDRELHGVHGVWKGDINRDGVIDLLADSFDGPHLQDSIAWFEAPGSVGDRNKSLSRHLVTQGGATGRAHYMDFADINQDGRGDVLLGASTEGIFTWWEQPQDLSLAWKRHRIADEPGATHPRAVDVDGDGQLDVIASAGHGVGVMWFKGPEWRKHSIDDSIRDVHAFDVGDLDNDGDIDACGCSFSEKIVCWWENRGDQTFVRHVIDRDQEAYDLKIVRDTKGGNRKILLAGRQSKNAVIYEVITDNRRQ